MTRPADPTRTARLALLCTTLAVLAGCSSLRSDGPPANPPPDLIKVPDADPRLEPIRIGGPNKPYEALGHLYTPLREDKPFNERGLASWYGRKFQGKRTSSGEPYDMYAMTAAHRTMPIPSYARVRNPANGKEVVVRINDRGPFHSDRVVDLSYTAALKLGVLNGVQPVEITRITFEDIRTGAWRKPGSAEGAADMAAVAPSGTFAAGSAGASGAAAADTAPVVVDVPVTPAVATNAAANASTNANVAPPATTAAVPSVAPTSVPSPAGAPLPASPEPAPSTDPVVAARTEAVTGGFWVQLGAFKQAAGADAFHRRVAADIAWLSPVLTVARDGGFYRLQAGPYADREQAQGVSGRIKESLRLVPVIVDKR